MTIKPPITLKFKLSGGKGSIIPPGVIETLIINVLDGVATFKFLDCRTTKKFYESGKSAGYVGKYDEHRKITIRTYPTMSQKEIVDGISKKIKELEGKK